MTSRVKKSFKNSSIGSVSQIISTFLNFLVRTIFIYYLSSEYLGINGLFSNILYILNFAELGFGNAIIYNLYKPVFEGNEEKIKAWIKLYKKIYMGIGIFVILAGLLVIPFMPYFIKDVPNIKESIVLIYILYLLETAGTYFYGYKRSIFLVYEKNYVNSLVDLFFSIVKSIFQAIVLILFQNFILYLIIYVLSTIVSNIYISIKANKDYPFLKEKTTSKVSKEEVKELWINVKSLVMYKIGSTVLKGTDNIIISMFIGIIVVGIYSNYSVIIGAVSGVLWTILTGLTGSIGNLNTTRERKKQEEIFNQTLFISCFLYGLSGVMLLILLKPFICLWIGSEYLLDDVTVIFVVIVFYLRGIAFASEVYRNTLGLFKEGKNAPLFCAIINIILSVILAKTLGLSGIFLATIISILVTTFWYIPKIIYTKIFNSNFFNYLKKIFTFTIPFIISFVILYFAFNNIKLGSILWFIIEAVISFVLTLFIFVIMTFSKEEFKCIKEKIFSLKKNKKEVSLEKQKEIQLNGLLYLKDVCDKNNIRYFLASGTLLGAVKYKGYIPWDDDIDVCLKRCDYNRLISLLEKENSEYKVLTPYNTKDYYYPFAKLCAKKTTLFDNAKKIKEMGVYIDIFPIDYFDDLNYYHEIRFVRNMASRRMRIKNHLTKSNFKKIEIKKVKFKFFKDIVYGLIDFITFPLGYNFWTKKLDKLVSKKEKGKYSGIIYKTPPKFLPGDLFDEVSEYEFEGNYFTSVKDFDSYLKILYGDYMKELEENEKRTHHQNKVYWR